MIASIKITCAHSFSDIWLIADNKIKHFSSELVTNKLYSTLSLKKDSYKINKADNVNSSREKKKTDEEREKNETAKIEAEMKNWMKD